MRLKLDSLALHRLDQDFAGAARPAAAGDVVHVQHLPLAADDGERVGFLVDLADGSWPAALPVMSRR